MNGSSLRDRLTEMRGTFDSLPGIVDALSKLPAVLRGMPAAPVVVGALTRVAADAIAGELRRRGPSSRFADLCEARGLEPAFAAELFETLVDEVRA